MEETVELIANEGLGEQYNAHVINKDWGHFTYLHPIDLRWYHSDTASSTALFSNVNSAPNVVIWTEFCLLDN
eukprot:171664-Ditylum_brightwellii.AAC.1